MDGRGRVLSFVLAATGYLAIGAWAQAEAPQSGGTVMAGKSRIGVVQPERPAALFARLAKEDEKTWADYADRLNPHHDSFDISFKRIALDVYIRHLCGLLRYAGRMGCDMVLLPECCLPIGDPKPGSDQAIANFRQSCLLAEKAWRHKTAPIARKYGMIIASCYYRSEGDRLYNDAVLMDEQGKVAGIYHKVHLPCPLDWDVSEAGFFAAGDEYPVFNTRVGKVGFQICYDIDFSEGVRILALKGADLVLHPTVGYNFPDEEEVVAEARLRTRATDNSVALAYANFGPTPGRSAIYTPNGNQVACAGRGVDKLVYADLDLKAPRMQEWGSGRSHNHRDQLARKRRPDTYGLLVAPRPPLLRRSKGPEGRLYEYGEEVGLP